MSPLQLIDTILSSTDSVEICFTVEGMEFKDFEALAKELGLVVDVCKAYDPVTQRRVLFFSPLQDCLYVYLG